MHLGGNRRWVPLTNEALSIIICVKIYPYAIQGRIKRWNFRTSRKAGWFSLDHYDPCNR